MKNHLRARLEIEIKRCKHRKKHFSPQPVRPTHFTYVLPDL
jgi:hypothetical protein